VAEGPTEALLVIRWGSPIGWHQWYLCHNSQTTRHSGPIPTTPASTTPSATPAGGSRGPGTELIAALVAHVRGHPTAGVIAEPEAS
jgi:hypothetical protein